MFAFELVVALPYDSAVLFACGVPYLCTEECTAITAYDTGCEDAVSAVLASEGTPPCILLLNSLPLFRGNNSRVAFLDEVLWDLTLVDLYLLGKVIHREGLLKKCRTFVFFIGEDAFNRCNTPFFASGGRWNTLGGKFIGNRPSGLSSHKIAVNTAHIYGLCFVDDKRSVFAFVVSKEMLVCKADLAIRCTFAFAPGYVLGNGSAFLLGDGRHNGEEKLTLGVECPYVFLFKEDLDTFFFELSDRKQAVNRVSCKTADRLCYDEVNLTVQGSFNHLVKAVTAFGTRSRNALVGVNLYELPFRVLFDVLGVVVNLGFVGSELFVLVG